MEKFFKLHIFNEVSKNQYKIDKMQKAIDASLHGFADIVGVFPVANSVLGGERGIESVLMV
jgi:Xaa-Pro aminopeptidase